MKSKTELDNLLNQKQEFNFNQVIEEIFFYFKKTYLLNGLVILILSLIIIIPILYLMGIYGLFEETDPQALEKITTNSTFIFYFSLASIFISVILAPINAGLIQINRDIDTDTEVSINNIFKHYKSKHYLQIVVFTIILQIINLILVQGVTFIGLPFLGNILNVLLTLLSILSIPFIIFNNLNAYQALVYSFKFATKNFLNIFVIMLITYLITICGLFAFCIGIFFTIPIVYSTQYVLYKNIIGFNDDTIKFDIETNSNN